MMTLMATHVYQSWFALIIQVTKFFIREDYLEAVKVLEEVYIPKLEKEFDRVFISNGYLPLNFALFGDLDENLFEKRIERLSWRYYQYDILRKTWRRRLYVSLGNNKIKRGV